MARRSESDDYMTESDDAPPRKNKGQGPVKNTAQPAPHTQQRQQSREGSHAGSCNDIAFVILFVLALLGFAAAFFANTGNLSELGKSESEGSDEFQLSGDAVTMVILAAGVCMAFASCFSGVWLYICYLIPETLISICMVVVVILMFVLAIALVFVDIFLAIIFFVIAAFITYLFYTWRIFIPFSGAMLRAVTKIISDYKATLLLVAGGLFCQCVWIILWGFVVSVCFVGVSADMEQPSYGQIFLALFLLLVFYWVTEVIKTSVHVTNCGTFSSWYFNAGTVAHERNPTLKAFKRTMTTSFGSVCFGSLLVAILKLIRAILRMLRRSVDNGFVVMCLECIIGCIEALFQYFNHYAYVLVAMHGYPYIQAAKETWELIKEGLISAIINDNLIGVVITVGSLLCALFTGVLGGLLGYALIKDDSENTWIVCAVFGFVIGYVICLTVMLVVESGASTLFVGWAIDPSAIETSEMPDKVVLHSVIQDYRFLRREQD